MHSYESIPAHILCLMSHTRTISFTCLRKESISMNKLRRHFIHFPIIVSTQKCAIFGGFIIIGNSGDRFATGTIYTHLWPYALKMANDILNQVPQKSGRTPLINFSGSNVQPKIQSHTFGCPVYALDSKLASVKTISQWDSRSCLGIYLGQLPSHSCTAALVLNPTNGLVSPQSHVRFDDSFETLQQHAPIVFWPKIGRFQGGKSISLT